MSECIFFMAVIGYDCFVLSRKSKVSSMNDHTRKYKKQLSKSASSALLSSASKYEAEVVNVWSFQVAGTCGSY